MADYYNPTNGAILLSAHEPPSPDWIKNPAGIREAQVIPVQYRVFKNGRVQEASKSQKTAINKLRLPAIKAARKAALAEESRQRLALATQTTLRPRQVWMQPRALPLWRPFD